MESENINIITICAVSFQKNNLLRKAKIFIHTFLKCIKYYSISVLKSQLMCMSIFKETEPNTGNTCTRRKSRQKWRAVTQNINFFSFLRQKNAL